MLSRRSLSVLTFAALTFIVLALTSRRLGTWNTMDYPGYRPPPGQHNQHEALGDSSSDANATTPNLSTNPDFPPRPARDPLCETFPDTSGILLVMKTGASEAFGKVPTQLMTMLKCLPDFLIFSDMDQKIGGYQIHDSLSSVLNEAKEGNSDFDLYRRQKWCAVDQDNCNKLGDPASEGWNLDKYKNLHMAEKTYNMRPHYDWYIFVDADTYVLWPNLVKWLGQLKSDKKHYIGSVAMMGGFPFGHGGSGYVVSKASMEALIGQNPGVGNMYDVRAKKECCGDYLFALAMKEKADIPVHNVWPTINGEKPSTLPFGPSHWCHPIVTMHHMNSEEINAMWEYERKLYGSKNPHATPEALLIKDIYHALVASKMQGKREDWDNLSDNRFYLDTEDNRYEKWQKDRVWHAENYNDLQKKAHHSFADCAALCESQPVDECFQYKFEDGICATNKAFSLGKPVKAKDPAKRAVSGWDLKKIKKWIEEQGECDKVSWPKGRKELQ